eukprot:5375331-Prymnesium_polylepis.1
MAHCPVGLKLHPRAPPPHILRQMATSCVSTPAWRCACPPRNSGAPIDGTDGPQHTYTRWECTLARQCS